MSYRNQSVNLHCKIVGWSQYDAGFLPRVSERILAINDTYMINTVVTVVTRFGASSKHTLLKFYCF